MKIHPVKRYSEPRYPTNRVLDQHPELLRLIPKRWQGNPVLIAALTGLCVLTASCRALSSSKPPTPTSRVAPIFRHGYGVGGYGCVATAAPVFLSEEEARKIIVDEGKRGGLTFEPGTAPLKGISVPVIEKMGDQVPRKRDGKLEKVPARFKTKKADVKPDGVDKKRKVSFEFVSTDDFEAWSVKDPRITSTWISTDLLGTAALFRESLAKSKPLGDYGVFYDPVSYEVYQFNEEKPSADVSARNEAVRKQAETDLRGQVKDFIKWLKSQGVI